MTIAPCTVVFNHIKMQLWLCIDIYGSIEDENVGGRELQYFLHVLVHACLATHDCSFHVCTVYKQQGLLSGYNDHGVHNNAKL